MSKILEASADESGKVFIQGIEIPGAIVLSEGKQASVGFVILEGDKVFYLPSSATDIKATIEKLISVIDEVSGALTKIGSSLTAIGAGMSGPSTAPPPTLPADVSEITSKVSELTSIKTSLNTLKGALK